MPPSAIRVRTTGFFRPVASPRAWRRRLPAATLPAAVTSLPPPPAPAAARYDWIRVPFEDLIDATQSGLHIFRRLSPRAGLTWSGGRGHEVFASVSRGFRAPAVVELACADPRAACPLPFALGPDPALKPVVATTYELGWRVRAPGGGGRVEASADVYRTDVRDDIFFIASTVTGGYFQNIGATRRSGVELALQWRAPPGGAGGRARGNGRRARPSRTKLPSAPSAVSKAAADT